MVQRLSLETLEERNLLSVTFQLNGDASALTLTGGVAGPHSVLVRPTANVPGSVDVVADGVTQSFTGLTKVNYINLDQTNTNTDYFTNRVATLPGRIFALNSNNVIATLAPNSSVRVGNGANTLQVTGGSSQIATGDGNNSVYGGPSDYINVGAGQDVVYDILPGRTTVQVNAHTTVDHLFTGPQTTLIGAMPQDHTAQFFVTAPLGSGTLAQNGSTLYFAATNAGSSFYSFGNSQLLTVLYSINDGTGFKIAAFTNVNQIAAFGGAGNDTFVNNSNVDEAFYGAGGVNTLIGGYGSLDLEKAGGTAAGGSLVIGRSPIQNDLNGSGNTAASNTIIFLGGPQAQNILRTNSPTDVVVGLKATDTVVSLFPDNVIAALLPPYVPA